MLFYQMLFDEILQLNQQHLLPLHHLNIPLPLLVIQAQLAHRKLRHRVNSNENLKFLV